jgi:hypothetical protein
MTELKAFQDSYAETKQKYYEALQEAKTDPSQVQYALDLNSELAKQVREFIASGTESPDLTPELKKIQKEYLRLQQQSDRKETLNMILNEDQNKIKTLKWQYDLLLFFLGLSVLTIIFMIIQLGGQKILSSVTPTQYTATT